MLNSIKIFVAFVNNMEQNIQQEAQIIIQKKQTSIIEWVFKTIVVPVFALLIFQTWNNVNDMKAHLPVLEERVSNMEKKFDRLDTKFFTDSRFQYPYDMKREDPISLPNQK